jgi:hypothetical protein
MQELPNTAKQAGGTSSKAGLIAGLTLAGVAVTAGVALTAWAYKTGKFKRTRRPPSPNAVSPEP